MIFVPLGNLTLRAMATELNARGMHIRRSDRWQMSGVMSLLAKIAGEPAKQECKRRERKPTLMDLAGSGGNEPILNLKLTILTAGR
jgi:hypothetical protein